MLPFRTLKVFPSPISPVETCAPAGDAGAGVTFVRAKVTKTRLGRSPLGTSLGVRGCQCVKLVFGPSPLLWPLSLPPHQATMATGPMTGWFPPPGLLWRSGVPAAGGFAAPSCCAAVRAVWLARPVGSLVLPWGIREGQAPPLHPTTQEIRQCGNVQGLFAPGPRQLGTVAHQGKALAVEAIFSVEAGAYKRIVMPSM